MMQMLPDAGYGDLAVGRRDSEELAPNVLLRCAALRCVDVRGLGADHCLVWTHHALQAEHVGGCSAEDEENLRVFSQLRAHARYGFIGVRIAAV